MFVHCAKHLLLWGQTTVRDERISGSGLASGFAAFDYFSGKSGIVTYWDWRKNYLYQNNSSLHFGDVSNCIGNDDDIGWFLLKTETKFKRRFKHRHLVKKALLILMKSSQQYIRILICQ